MRQQPAQDSEGGTEEGHRVRPGKECTKAARVSMSDEQRNLTGAVMRAALKITLLLFVSVAWFPAF